MNTRFPLPFVRSPFFGARRTRAAGAVQPGVRSEIVTPSIPDPAAPGPPPLVDIVVPVYNEQRDLVPSVRRLRSFLDAAFPFPARITIADNASTDATWRLAQQLSDELPGTRALHLSEKGRGRALRAAWTASDAPIVAYMDVDLSTDLAALLPLIAPLVSGHSDVAIGSRLARGSHVVRGAKREVISRSYNLILRTVLRVGFSDAQCGFKAIRAVVARRLLPAVKDQAWFFDTELLVLAERAGLRIHEVPVDWQDDPDSRVHLRSTITEDLKGVRRLLADRITGRPLPAFDDLLDGTARGRLAGRPSTTRQVTTFAAIGVLSTLAYVVLYAALRGSASAGISNAVALLVTAVANTAANRRLTFAVQGRSGLGRDHAAGLVAFAVALAITSGSIAALQALAPSSGRLVEVTVLVVANAAATVARFVLLRSWIGRTARPARATARQPERIAS